jgi:hypothetical protein
MWVVPVGRINRGTHAMAGSALVRSVEETGGPETDWRAVMAVVDYVNEDPEGCVDLRAIASLHGMSDAQAHQGCRDRRSRPAVQGTQRGRSQPPRGAPPRRITMKRRSCCVRGALY